MSVITDLLSSFSGSIPAVLIALGAGVIYFFKKRKNKQEAEDKMKQQDHDNRNERDIADAVQKVEQDMSKPLISKPDVDEVKQKMKDRTF